MDISYYKLEFNPFDRDSPQPFQFVSRDFIEMTSQLNYLAEKRGIGLFTARPGMGKSHCLKQFAKSMEAKQAKPLYIMLTTVSVLDFYSQLNLVLGLPHQGRKSKLFHQFQDYVRYLYNEQHNPLILAIDEAQYLSDKILQDLQLLMNYNYDSENLFTLILCGEQSLNQRLSSANHTALRQRLTVHYTFAGLDEKETAEYIYGKIENAGGSRSMVDPASLEPVMKYAGGNPRLIDNVMGYAIMLGSQLEKETISPALTAAAVEAQRLR